MHTYTQSGRSMIEMLGVLAIVGVLSAGGITGYSMAMQSHKTNQVIEKMNMIAMQARKLYKGDYTDVDIQDLVDGGKIPDITNPFGGNFQMGKWDTNNFWLYAGNLPAEACTDIVQADWGKEGVFGGLIFHGESTPFAYSDKTYPLTTATAISKCAGGDKGVYLIFK